jgi:hypothetical protein
MRKLLPLVGTWAVSLRWSAATHKLVGGPPEIEAEAEISWLGRRGILHYQFGPSHWLAGSDETNEGYTVLYADARGVTRIYQMSFVRGVWRIWRDAPGFRQRFEGRVRDGGRRIEAFWDKAEDDGSWVRDFDMTFSRSKRGVGGS